MIEGKIEKTLFRNNDNGYSVCLLKIKDNDIDPSINNKVITITGYFSELDNNTIYEMTGEFVRHPKYGSQFSVKTYTVTIPNSENGIITFLSSNLFKGIGEKKATKIYETLGDNTIHKIIDDYTCLKGIIPDKDIISIYETLLKYSDSSDTVIKLNELGFNNKDSIKLYNKYKDKIFNVINENIYNLVDNDFNFRKIDPIALKNNYNNLDSRRISSCILYVMEEDIINIGNTYLNIEEIYKKLTNELNTIIEEDLFKECLNNLIKTRKIIKENNNYFITRMYEAERNIIRRLCYLNNLNDLKIKNLDQEFSYLESNYDITYNDEQVKAIKNAFIKQFLIITGGPGTGKTTLIKSIIDLYKNIYKLSGLNLRNRVIMLAPTGRAAKRMMESCVYPAQTIHRFLKWNKETNKFGVNEYNKIDCDMIIIDESSMIDTYLMDSLLKGLNLDTKIILVGDYNQLPSVGSGKILKDLIDSDSFNVVKLNKLYRQEDNSNIINFAYDINNGIFNEDILNVESDLNYIECDSYNLQEKLIDVCKNIDIEESIILAPQYKTLNGIDNLNLTIRELYNPKMNQNELVIGDTKYREKDKVILLVNMPDDNVYNGDIGTIININPKEKELYVDFDDNIVKFNTSNYNNIKLGYVISIHKSQGSEFKNVILCILPEYSRMLYRKLLYTGVTRAKEKVYLLGDKTSINKTILNNNTIERKTNLLNLISEYYN